MSVANELYVVETIGSGSIPSIAFNRKVFNDTDVKGVSVTSGVQTTLTNGVDFTVTGAGDTSTGVTVTPAALIPVGTTWYTYTDQGAAQGQIYSAGGEFPAKSHEYSLDKLAIAIQEVEGKVDNPSGLFPDGRSSTVWTYDSNGDFTLLDLSLFLYVGDSADRVKNITDVSYTLLLTDNYKILEMNNASPNTLTLPQDSDVDFPVGGFFDVVQVGAGLTSIAAGTGATVQGELVSFGQYKAFSIYKRAANTWLVTGGTT